MSAPTVAVQAFLDATSDEDEAGAAAQCTVDGWHDTETDSPRRFFQQSIRKGLTGVPVEGPVVEGTRAVQRVLVGAGPRPRPVWFLLHNDAGWHIDGVVRANNVAALFLDGTLSARVSVHDLPRSLAAEAWAMAAVRRANTSLITTVEGLAATAKVLGASPQSAAGRLPEILAAPSESLAWLATGDLVRAIEEAGRPEILLVVPANGESDSSGLAVRLAATFAGTGVRTLLADLDFRSSQLDGRLPAVSTTPGLGGMIDGRTNGPDAEVNTALEGLCYLRAGRVRTAPKGDPAEVVVGALTGLGHQVVVLAGLPPVSNKAMAALAANPSVGVVLAVAAGRTSTDDVVAALEALGGSCLGAVLTEVIDASLPDFDDESFAELSGRVAGNEASVSVAGSVALPSVNRAIAGLSYGDGGELWTLFETDDDGGLRQIGHGAMASLMLLLQGIERFPAGTGSDAEPASKPPLDAEGMAVVETLLSGVIAAAEASKGDSPTASQAAEKVPRAFATFFQQTLQKANQEFKRDPELDNKIVDIREARERLRGSETDPVADSLKEALGAFMEQVSTDGDEVSVDPDFLQEHGADLVGKLLGAVFSEVIPPDLGLEVPKKDDDGKVKVKIDMAKMFGGLLGQLQQAASQAKPTDKPADAPNAGDNDEV